jgi:DNA gyrase subunit A
MSQEERVAAILPVRSFEEKKSVVMVSKKGVIKKTELEAFSNPRSTGIIAVSVDEGDELMDVKLTCGGQDIFLATRRGMSIRFQEDEVRDMGRIARGVRGIHLEDDDEVVGVDIPVEGSTMLTVSEKGYGKRTDIAEYRLQGRGGRGTINLKTVPRIGNVSGILQVMGTEDIMLISSAGNIIRVKVEEIPVIGRSTQGVKLIDLAPEEKLVGIARADKESAEKDGENGDGLPEEEV